MAQQIITVAQPAAGADWRWTMPTGLGARARIIGLGATLVTSAAVANRRINVRASPDGTGPVVASISNTAVTAGSSVFVSAWAGGESVSWTSGAMQLGLPAELELRPGGYIEGWVGLIDVADQWGPVRLAVDFAG
jgi:hypothetical protein